MRLTQKAKWRAQKQKQRTPMLAPEPIEHFEHEGWAVELLLIAGRFYCHCRRKIDGAMFYARPRTDNQADAFSRVEETKDRAVELIDGFNAKKYAGIPMDDGQLGLITKATLDEYMCESVEKKAFVYKGGFIVLVPIDAITDDDDVVVPRLHD